jgi:hypothetical protein
MIDAQRPEESYEIINVLSLINWLIRYAEAKTAKTKRPGAAVSLKASDIEPGVREDKGYAKTSYINQNETQK